VVVILCSCVVSIECVESPANIKIKLATIKRNLIENEEETVSREFQPLTFSLSTAV
jgi:hypothetical protein